MTAPNRFADALTEHADQILAGWANVLEPHALALTEAARLLPADLSDVRTITDRGADALHAWANAQDALKLWNTTAASFRSLAITAGIAVNKTDPLIITAATGDQLAAGPDGIHQLTSDPGQLVRAGIPLRLATITDFMQRQASLSHWKQERNRIAERKRLHDQTVALSA